MHRAGREACAVTMRTLTMKKTIAKLMTLAFLLVLCAGLLSPAAQAADNQLSMSGQAKPNTLTGPGTVNVSLNVLNLSDVPTPINVTLLDPNGNTCASFGSGGTASLGPGQSRSYSGTWAVTEQQLNAGRITYNARYAFPDESGNTVSANQSYSISIKHNTAKPGMSVQRKVEPSAAVKGQVVKISYTLKNTGTVDITDIIVKDPGVISSEVRHALLKVGETAEISYTYTADDTSKTTAAKFTYNYKIGDKVEIKEGESDPLVIDIATPDLTVELSADKASAANGEKVTIKAVVTNKSQLTYEKVNVTDEKLGSLESNITIKPNDKKEFTREITMGAEAQKYQVKVAGVDSSGSPVSFESNVLNITVPGGALVTDPPVLTLELEADRTEIYTKPSEVVFRASITNNGNQRVEKITLQAGGKDVVKDIFVDPGQTVPINKVFRVSTAGTFQFVAVVKQGTEKHTVESNKVEIAYKALTPSPTPIPMPTEEPMPTQDPQAMGTLETPVPEPTQPPSEPMTFGKWLLYGLLGLLVLVIMGVVLLFVLDRRRNKPAKSGGGATAASQMAVIDSIQRSPHRDYARVPKKNAKPAKEGRKRKGREKEAEEPDMNDFFRDETIVRAQPSMELDEPPRGARPMRAEEPMEPELDDMGAAYRRPDAVSRKADSVDEFSPDAFDDVDNINDMDDFDLEDETLAVEPKEPAIDRDYLARIRGAVSEDDAQEDDDDELSAYRPPATSSKAEPPIEPLRVREPSMGTMSDQDAAVLSGSTGQYRLSRSSPRVMSNMREDAESPEDFVRRQRTSRAPGRADASRYDGDDDSSRSSRRRRG